VPVNNYNFYMATENIKFDIIKHFGVISSEKSGWQKELNLVSWNGRAPKLDVRDWAPGHEKMGKGITLTEGEAAALAELLVFALAKPENPPQNSEASASSSE
jgi:hypothetical protein